MLLLLFDNSEQERSLKHPLLLLTSPPLQPTIIGYLPELGTITLENCCQVDRQVSTNLQTGLRSYRLFLKPTAIWLGSQKSIVEQTLSCLSLFDGRLEGFFKSPGLVNYMWPSDETKAGFEALGSPTAIWAFHGDAFPKFEVEAEGFNVQIESAAVHSSSSRTGYALQALTKITVKLIKLANISDYMRVKTRLEQMLSIFSLEGFSFEVPIYEGEGCSIALAWEWAQDTSLFTPPMQHQVLVDLSDKDVFAAICRGWFRSSEVVELSRWLFCKALKETTDGLARFVTVCQALEVLGRELGPPAAISKSEFRRAVAAISDALVDFQDAFLCRIIQLVQSSNSASFRHVLEHMIVNAANALEPKPSEGEVSKFARLIADTRNAVVHMTTTKKTTLNDAFGRVNKLSLLICFWYAIIQANHLGLTLPNAATFLFNNRTARHGLPNEALERAARQSWGATFGHEF